MIQSREPRFVCGEPFFRTGRSYRFFRLSCFSRCHAHDVQATDRRLVEGELLTVHQSAREEDVDPLSLGGSLVMDCLEEEGVCRFLKMFLFLPRLYRLMETVSMIVLIALTAQINCSLPAPPYLRLRRQIDTSIRWWLTAWRNRYIVGMG